MTRFDFRRSARSIEVPCTVEIAETRTRLEAHVALAGVAVEPGDSVVVHDAPSGVDYGATERWSRRATVTRAGRLERIWTRIAGLRELGELLEVGFSSRRTP